jgi:Flp pilus assembly pilin Flp
MFGGAGVDAARCSTHRETRHRLRATEGRCIPLLKLFGLAPGYAVAELRTREEGQTMAEYGVVLAIITLVVITAISVLSGAFVNAITSVADIIPGP